MIVALLIYLLGCIVSFILDYRYTLNEYEEIKINDLGFFFIMSLGSWASVITGLFIYRGDKVVVRKKPKELKKIPAKWTATDKGKVENVKGALFKLEREHGLSFIEEIKWLNDLKYRIVK